LLIGSWVVHVKNSVIPLDIGIGMLMRVVCAQHVPELMQHGLVE